MLWIFYVRFAYPYHVYGTFMYRPKLPTSRNITKVATKNGSKHYKTDQNQQ